MKRIGCIVTLLLLMLLLAGCSASHDTSTSESTSQDQPTAEKPVTETCTAKAMEETVFYTASAERTILNSVKEVNFQLYIGLKKETTLSESGRLCITYSVNEKKEAVPSLLVSDAVEQGFFYEGEGKTLSVDKCREITIDTEALTGDVGCIAFTVTYEDSGCIVEEGETARIYYARAGSWIYFMNETEYTDFLINQSDFLREHF